jgi:hypothetical protein
VEMMHNFKKHLKKKSFIGLLFEDRSHNVSLSIISINICGAITIGFKKERL